MYLIVGTEGLVLGVDRRGPIQNRTQIQIQKSKIQPKIFLCVIDDSCVARDDDVIQVEPAAPAFNTLRRHP